MGYGYSHDPNNIHYNNSGLLLSGDFYTITQTPWTHWSLLGSLGQWYSSTPSHKNLTTGAVSLGLRLYPVSSENNFSPYLIGTAGPAILSNRQFGVNTQAKNITIQTNAGLGLEHGHYDLNFRLEHFSNAGLSKPNEGFNILYLLSVGYLF